VSQSISVVVPVYDSAPTLHELVERLHSVLSSRPGEFEIVLVNDGSPDESWKTIESLAQRCPSVRGIDLMRNSGQHNAVLAGVRAARHDVVVTLDDDLQHPPEAVPTLLDALGPGIDIVYGTAQREQHGWWRDLGSRGAKYSLRALLAWSDATRVSDFRAFRTRLRDGFAAYDGPAVAFDVLLASTTTAVTNVVVAHAPRKAGHSHYRLSLLAEYGVTMATGYSTRPLRVALAVGASLVLLGTIGGAAASLWWAHDGTSIGIAVGFIIAITTMLTGLQLVAVGILGEYVGRTYFRVLPKPAYIVRREISHPDG
jgi:glycosyltransferase involved in cell wall biosynthesis